MTTLYVFAILVVLVLISRAWPKKDKYAMLDSEYVVFDLETTGLQALRHEIIEIGAIKVKRGQKDYEIFNPLVKPKKRIPEKITDLTGITQEMVDDNGRDLEQAIRDFAEFVGDLRLVAFNAEFDMAFLKAAGDQFGVSFRENKVSCALKMARKAWPKLKSYKLVNLAKLGGISTSGAHRALKDCEITVAVYASAAAALKRP